MKNKRILFTVLALLACFWLMPGVAGAAQGDRLIAITFDDGPCADTTRLLDGLRERDVKVTFFMLGSLAGAYPNTAARAYQEGHQIANHSYNHADMAKLSDWEIADNFQRSAVNLQWATGGAEDFMVRLPYGSGGARALANAGAPVILWSVDPLDWKYRDAETVRSSIVSKAFDGAIVLVHDIHPTSIDGALMAIDDLKAAGYEFVTVRELFRRRGVTPETGVQYYSCKPTGVDAGPVAAPVINNCSEVWDLLFTISGPEWATIYYTTDGSDPLYYGQVYERPFTVPPYSTIRAIAAYNLNGSRSAESVYSLLAP